MKNAGAEAAAKTKAGAEAAGGAAGGGAGPAVPGGGAGGGGVEAAGVSHQADRRGVWGKEAAANRQGAHEKATHLTHTKSTQTDAETQTDAVVQTDVGTQTEKQVQTKTTQPPKTRQEFSLNLAQQVLSNAKEVRKRIEQEP